MKRKNLMTVLMCTFCLAVSSVAAPAVVMAEEETAGVEENTDAEDDTEGADETEGTAETEALEYPEYKASDYVTLGDYKGLTVTVDPIAVTDEEIEQQIQENIELAGALETVEDGTVEYGDTANIDYEGKLDGEAFDGGTAKEYDLTIGSHTFIDGFEDGLVGAAVGETLDIPLTFPESYFSEDLAGKDVVFTVTVNEIKRAPELTDELVNTITEGDYTDVASYTDYIRSSLESSKEEEKKYNIQSDILTHISDSSEIKEYPQEAVDYYVSSLESGIREEAEMYGMEFGYYLSVAYGLAEEDFQNQAVMVAQQNLQIELYLKAISEAESLELSEEEYQAGCEDYASRYGYNSGEELVAANGEDMIRRSLMMDKVLNFLVDNAVIEEAAETESETGSEAETDSADTAAEAETEA